MTKVLMRATDKMPVRHARRMQYRTRMLTADIQGGGEFEIPSSDARILRKAGWAEDVTEAQAAPKRGPGRPRKAAAAEVEPEQAADPYPDKSVPDLRALAEERGIALPYVYVRRAELIEYLEGKKVYVPELEAGDGDYRA